MQDWIAGDIRDQSLLDAAMTDIDVVVHLAAVLEDRPFEPDLLETNIRGAYRVFESARQHRVRRMIFASSPQLVFWRTVGRNRPLGADSSFAPLDIYAVTKIFGEQLGWLYGNQYGLPTIAIRFGWLPHNEENQRKLENSPDYHDWYLSPGDAAPAWRWRWRRRQSGWGSSPWPTSPASQGEPDRSTFVPPESCWAMCRRISTSQRRKQVCCNYVLQFSSVSYPV